MIDDKINYNDNNNNLHKIIIIGSGPAGLTAAIYAARGGMEPLVISGHQPGGQLILTTDVENFPGFDVKVLGADLMSKMRKQVERVGTKFADKDAIVVDLFLKPFKVEINGNTDSNIINNDDISCNSNNIKSKEDKNKKLLAESIIIATGT